MQGSSQDKRIEDGVRQIKTRENGWGGREREREDKKRLLDVLWAGSMSSRRTVSDYSTWKMMEGVWIQNCQEILKKSSV